MVSGVGVRMASEQVSLILEAIEGGSPGAEERLFRLVYDEFHRMAHGF